MSDIVIQVENLSKRYTIGHLRNAGSGDGLRHRIEEALRSPWRWLRRRRERQATREEFWALKDVSFEVGRGEVVGIIGRNGAGKSTLLKILSRITEPTQGRIRLKGRVASLLEVGTGFHPELTGRENIFLNGAILGMSRAEIRRKFDEIVAFSEIETFLDTAVKRYSSGMYVRLAFAVAAHLEPEILIVDEVLAVGDAEFQKKCLGKMRDVSQGGRTVLFVSHNMSAVRTLCGRGIVMSGGRKTFDGTAVQATDAYSSTGRDSTSTEWRRPTDRATPVMHFEYLRVSVGGEQPRLKLACLLKIRCSARCPDTFVAVDVTDRSRVPILQAVPEGRPFIKGQAGLHTLQLEIDLPPLIPGAYIVDFWIGSSYSSTFDYIRDAVAFEVELSPARDRSFPHSADHGYIVPASRCVALATTFV